jgi:hypothetical protein
MGEQRAGGSLREERRARHAAENGAAQNDAGKSGESHASSRIFGGATGKAAAVSPQGDNTI